MIVHRAAVLGKPIDHSLSPVIHSAGFKAAGLSESWEYTRFECTAAGLPTLVAASDPSFVGFSVTMPGKFAALAFADTRSARAEAIGSANTLVRTKEGTWCADNTDCDGIRVALAELGVVKNLAGCDTVVIGGGGTARPAIWQLAQLGAKTVTVINRSDKSADLAPLVAGTQTTLRFFTFDTDLLALCHSAAVVVSTVPSVALVGKENAVAQAPVLDVIYDPWPTPLVQAARAHCLPAVGGHVMLLGQAFSQFEQFTGRQAPRQAMRDALSAVLKTG